MSDHIRFMEPFGLFNIFIHRDSELYVDIVTIPTLTDTSYPFVFIRIGVVEIVVESLLLCRIVHKVRGDS